MRTPTVLFVDDEVAILEGVKRSLWKEPYVVLTASSGAAALALLATTEVDVVVSDQRMPELSGSELLGRIRDQYPKIVRIMLTGEPSLPTVVRALDVAPLYRFLNKPLIRDELTRTLRQAIQMKQLAEESARLHRGDPVVARVGNGER
jgi:DNA-binding NtrC family response regulator